MTHRLCRVTLKIMGSSFSHFALPFCLCLLFLLPCQALAQTCVQPPSGPIGWWPLDETTGTIAIDVAGNKPGAHFDGPTQIAGKVRGALQFDGVDDFIGVGDSDLWAFGNSDFTIELWAYFNSPGGGSIGHPSHIFIGNDEGPFTVNKWFFALGGGVLEFVFSSPSIKDQFLTFAPFAPNLNQWYHLAVRRQGDTFTAFVDGLPSGSVINTAAIPNPNAPLTIGQAESLGFMNGRLDEVTIYNRALTEAELQSIVDAGTAGKCKPLPAVAQLVSPPKGGDTGAVTVRITGSGFIQGASAKLRRDGNPDIPGNAAVLSEDGSTLTATFDLRGKARGLWDVVVMNPDETSSVLADSFTIEEGHARRLWTDIIGLGLIRINRDQSFSIIFGNSGNVNVESAAVIIGVPRDVATVCTIPGHVDIFSYDPAEPHSGDDPNFVFIETDVGRIAASEIRVIQCRLRVGDFDDANILAATFEDERFISGGLYSVLPDTALGLSNNTFVLVQGAPRVRMIVFDGYGFGRNGLRSRITHPFLVIDGNVYNKSGPTLVRWTLKEFEKQVRAKIDSSNTYQVGGAEGTIPLTDHTWLEVPLDGHPNFPGLDPDGLKANLDASVGQTGADRSCIQTLDDVGESYGLNLLPESLEGSGDDQYQQAGEFLRRLNIDPFTVPTGKGRNPEGRPFQRYGEFLTDWLRSLPTAIQRIIRVIFSFDPNDKVGSQGVGEQRFLAGEEPLRYSIFFENVETATAPAQEVVITDQLDTSKIDLDSLSLGPISFGNTQIVPPPGLTEYTTTVDLRPAKQLLVSVEGRLDKITGLLTWRFTSIDPVTGLLPDDPLAGFLPPNKVPPEGDGNVVFTVMPKKGLATGTEIRNQARIIFDTNAPIDTPEWFNTIDNAHPTSQVLSLSSTQCSIVQVEWSGADVGSGIDSYTIYVSDNGGPYSAWLINTTQTQAIFLGTTGHTYSFYSIARDKTGNVEAAPDSPDTVVTVDTNITLSSSGQDFTSSGGSGSVAVTAPGGCFWIASVNVPWITIISGSSGNGSGSLAFVVLRDLTNTTRTGAITVAGKTYTVRQLGDTDGDGIPDEIEVVEGTDPNVKDNDIFNNNRLFVKQQYRDFLSREAEADGITYWTGVMSQGEPRSQVINNFFNSDEFQTNIAPIARLYFAYFLRIPDYGGLLFWTDAIRSGQPLHVVSENFALSAEFQQRYSSLNNTQFVTLVYENVLGRTPSQVETEYWVGHLDAGRTTRGQVMLGFSESEEYKAKIHNSVYVTMIYIGMLRRAPEPAGLEFWLGFINGGASGPQLIENFLIQSEYHDRFLPAQQQ